MKKPRLDDSGLCHNHYRQFKLKTDPEFYEKHKKRQMEYYFKNHDDRKKRNNEAQKTTRIELIKKVGW